MELDSIAPGLVPKCSPDDCGEVPGPVETAVRGVIGFAKCVSKSQVVASWRWSWGEELGVAFRSVPVLKCSLDGCGEESGFVEKGLLSRDSGLGRQVGQLGLGRRSLRACF